ncbi:hypothetical protein [Prauserella endophytica]|uniref:hypothetical protein n=1 Tax=Prauserella TaxID=142577 RepID=UPI0026B9A804|nr:hypothetical protein [Prauserella endophytica]
MGELGWELYTTADLGRLLWEAGLNIAYAWLPAEGGGAVLRGNEVAYDVIGLGDMGSAAAHVAERGQRVLGLEQHFPALPWYAPRVRRVLQ